MENVKGHAISVLFLPTRRMSMSSGNSGQPPQPRSSSTRLTREVAQERRWGALGAQQQGERCRADVWGGGPLKLPLRLFSARGVCLTGAGRPLWEVNPASEN